MKVEFDTEEAWTIMSHIMGRLIDETELSDADRAKIRRWKSDEMRVTTQEMRILGQKINEVLAKNRERNTRSQLRKPDWR